MTTTEIPLHPTLVGIHEVADRLSTRRATVQQWISRGIMPPPRYYISGPIWDWDQDVYPWARRTRRLDPDSLYAIPPDVLGLVTPDQLPTLKRKLARRG